MEMTDLFRTALMLQMKMPTLRELVLISSIFPKWVWIGLSDMINVDIKLPKPKLT